MSPNAFALDTSCPCRATPWASRTNRIKRCPPGLSPDCADVAALEYRAGGARDRALPSTGGSRTIRSSWYIGMSYNAGGSDCDCVPSSHCTVRPDHTPSRVPGRPYSLSGLGNPGSTTRTCYSADANGHRVGVTGLIPGISPLRRFLGDVRYYVLSPCIRRTRDGYSRRPWPD